MPEKPTYEELAQRVLELEDADSKRNQAEQALRESESLLSSIFRAAPTGIGVVSNRILLAVNDRVCDMIGYSREEMIGQSARMLYPSDAHFENVGSEKYRRILQYGTGTVETQWRCKDGRIIDILMSSTPINPLDHSEGVTFTALDITERKKAEDALRESREELAEIFSMSLDMICIADINTATFLKVNPAFTRILGYSEQELLSRPFIEFIHPDDVLPTLTTIKERLQKGEAVINFINRYLCKDGTYCWLEWVSHPIPKRGVTFAVAHDITESKLAEQERTLNAQRMQALLQMNQMTEATLEEVTDFALEEAVRLTRSAIGYLAFLNDDESVLTMHSWSKSAMAECAIANKPIIYSVETTGLWGEAIRQRRSVITNDYTASNPLMKGYPEGHVTVRRHMNIPVFVGSRIFLVAGVGNKVEEYNQEDVQQLTLLMEGMWRLIERKQAEAELRESERKYRLIADNTADAIWMLDMNMRFTYVSPSVKRMYGSTVEEVVGRTIDNSMTPESLRAISRVFTEEMVLEASGTADPQRIRVIELEEHKRDRSTIWVESSMSFLRDENQKPVGIVGVSRDITDRKRAEEEKAKLESQLQQAQKFEAIGTLAGGVAHDFNNLLMGIQGRASLISMDLDVSHPHREHVNAIEEYIRSATSLTKQLLGFARGGKYEVNPVDMNELVLGSSAMFGRTKKEIRIHTKCQASPLVVEADRGQIEQVLLNIYINAWQAMPPDGGDLYLETKIVALDETYCKSHQAEPGRFVKVSITDTGAGMDEATRLRIFDPFFTTKGMGRGTGLGLASAFGIIKNHGGMITVYSEVGHGTTFNFYLPVSDKEAHREVSLEGGLIKGSATILLVDDEELIIDVGQAMLERLGYRVVVCRDGQETVNVITDIGKEIDLVILDMIMPGMDGGATFDRIREIQPEMPVILSSGYAINGHADKIMRRGCNGFIQKPYNISELSQKVRKVLDDAKMAAQ